jgi:diguanylate cyclase (GGDEF)-like protein/PAS domain S-box-containing protein
MGRTKRFIIGMLVLCTTFFCSTLFIQAAPEEEQKVLRVGFPVQKGFGEISEDGVLGGYTYEYLQEIAQYTGWKYEFVTYAEEGDINKSLTRMLDEVQSGELDLIGSVMYSDALKEIYEYPKYSYGTAYSNICVLARNTQINETNFHQYQNMRIAVVTSATLRNKELERFCEMNKMTPEFIYCSNTNEQIAALKEGRADAMQIVDVSEPYKELRTVAQFYPQPYYFVSAKGNTALTEQIDFAISKINESSPYFAQELYEKYFGNNSPQLWLSDQESEYIQQKQVIRALILPGQSPVQSYQDETGQAQGIAVDFLQYVREQTGLSFEFVPADSYEQARTMLEGGEADLIAGIQHDYSMAEQYQVSLTYPFIISQGILVVNKKIDPEQLDGKTLALPEDVSAMQYHPGRVVRYKTIEECMDAVNRGKADYCYGNAYMVQDCTNKDIYRNISLVRQPSKSEDICIGVARPADIDLLTILNKVIRSVPAEEMQAIVYRNTIRSEREISLASFVDANPRSFAVLICIASLFIILVVVWYVSIRLQKTQKIKLDNERYQQLCELSNEHIFEYDHLQDRMIFSQKSAEFFHMERVNEQYYRRLQERSDKEAEQLREFFTHVLQQNRSNNELLYPFPDGMEHWVRVTVNTIYNAAGNPVYSVGKMADIQEEVELREQLVEQAQRDSLTGIYNGATCRRLISQNLDADPGALFIIDIDYFKQVNDQYGHYKGDQVLICTAQALQQVCSKGDIAGRMGGDEFILYSKRTGEKEQVKQKCKQIIDRVQAVILDQTQIDVTISVGAVIVQPGGMYTDFYQKADQALYQVKERGRNGFEIV